MGSSDAARTTGSELGERLRRDLLRVIVTSNVLGGAVVTTVLALFFFDEEELREILHVDYGLLATAAYLAAAGAVAWRAAGRRTRWLGRWLTSGRQPDERTRDLVLRQPLRSTAPAAAVWVGAAAVLGAVEAVEHNAHRGLDVAMTILLGGITTCAITFLLAERVLRPAVARALAALPPQTLLTPGVALRLIVVWGLATGVPVLGLVLMGVVTLTIQEYSRDELAVAVAVLGALSLGAGLVGTWLVAGSLGQSLGAVRHALASVRAGDLSARVPVSDGSEVGLLQAGFNEMAEGLSERERLRDLFGRHVGEEVARAAVDSRVTLGGEVREVGALFVDIQESTALATNRPPTEVVALLNRFFEVVVDVVASRGGWVNKFEGDAALCVFGVPVDQPDFADRALAAARLLAERLRSEVPDLQAGIGVSGGPAVAGNVGAERRYEYTVIGDPVNEAARLCDLAKQRGGVLAAERLVERAGPEEAARWRPVGAEVLRGRPEPTGLAAPVRDEPEGPA